MPEQKPDEPSEQYQVPPLSDPEKDPREIENQLHGTEYDAALVEVTRLKGIAREHMNQSNFLGASLVATEGDDPGFTGIATTEGMAPVEREHTLLEPDQMLGSEVTRFREDLEAEEALRRIGELSPRLWQETGIRLFQQWQAGQLDPRTALTTYCEVWDTYSPAEFYTYCGVDHDTMKQLYSEALAAYAQTSSNARSLRDNISEHSFVRMIIDPALELGIDPKDFGL